MKKKKTPVKKHLSKEYVKGEGFSEREEREYREKEPYDFHYYYDIIDVYKKSNYDKEKTIKKLKGYVVSEQTILKIINIWNEKRDLFYVFNRMNRGWPRYGERTPADEAKGFYAKGDKLGSAFQYTPLTRSMQLAHDVLVETNKLMKKEFSKKELDFIKEKELVYIDAYSNTREQGYHLIAYPLASSFSENRNSDDLIMYFGNAYSDFDRQGNIPNEASYESREYISPDKDQIKNGAERLIKLIKDGFVAYKEKEEKRFAKGAKLEERVY